LGKRREKIGLPPGTPVYTGEKEKEEVRISIMDYSEDDFVEFEDASVEKSSEFKDAQAVTWINVDGIHKLELVEEIGEKFGIHSLALEDIVHTDQRPKMEEFENFTFIVLNMLTYNDQEREVNSEQISLILGQRFVISFQERCGDIFDPIRNRIRNGKGRIRRMGADYLAYALLDSVVDNYFIILEKIGAIIEELEESLFSDPHPNTMQEIHKLKRDILFLRKSIWPLRELISGLERSESILIKKTTVKYLRDVYDHTIQIIDTIETFRDLLSGIHDTYLTSLSNRMNEVMKVLTIIATIFIPLSFIVGVYGMNFKYMPELEWPWAYYAVWIVIIVSAALMILFFRKRKWF
jgi:magnesium transporter